MRHRQAAHANNGLPRWLGRGCGWLRRRVEEAARRAPSAASLFVVPAQFSSQRAGWGFFGAFGVQGSVAMILVRRSRSRGS